MLYMTVVVYMGNPIPALGYAKIIKGNDKFKVGSIVQGVLKAGKYAELEDPTNAMLMAKKWLCLEPNQIRSWVY
jgi:hypothetical protein